MTAMLFGELVKIPKGYHEDSNGYFINGHGVEYAPVQYGWGEDKVICLETVFSNHIRTIELEKA